MQSNVRVMGRLVYSAAGAWPDSAAEFGRCPVDNNPSGELPSLAQAKYLFGRQMIDSCLRINMHFVKPRKPCLGIGTGGSVYPP